MSLCIPVLAASVMFFAAESPPQFAVARPIWPAGRETERNLSVGFRAEFDADPGGTVLLRLTASTLYRVFVNGEFAGHGPARAGHGYFRVDEWDLSELLDQGANTVAIEVAGYNANSYYVMDQPAFLQAEIVAGGEVLAATGSAEKGFDARVISERVQKVQRYSFQRPFIEVYRLDPDSMNWRSNGAALSDVIPCVEQPSHPLLVRRVPYPTFIKRPPQRVVSRGAIETGVTPERVWKDRSLVDISDKLKGYPEGELDLVISTELQQMRSHTFETLNSGYDVNTSLSLDPPTFAILDMGTNLTGFLGATVECSAPTRLFFIFDEILSGDDVDFKRMGCVNSVTYELAPGTYQLESFEPYTLRYLKLIALDGACTVSNVYLREYVNPDVWGAHFAASDARINRLFEAGRETYAQNAVDVFMDCPSRERAGWLCDSLFTARVAQDLSGGTAVEKNFLENYLRTDGFAHLPEGMLPMCYPSDHYDGVFIPNWAMWFVIELEEYLARSGDREMVDALRPRVLALLKYFEPFRNEDGLIEKLESWVFIEWSEANRFVQDVNYPSNMLYAAVLRATGRMYDMPDLLAEGEKLRAVVHDQSFDGEFFVDNAVRKDGKLEVTQNRSEVCQYFAFFFDVATPETHPELWDRLCTQFGPDRKDTKAFADVHLANSFIGNMLRFEILSRYQKGDQILPESIGYLLYMAERTGTLWENVSEAASCNHGFASHIVHTLYRDVLGLYVVDSVNKTITVRLSDIPLEWCEGRKPLPDGSVSMRWWKDGETINYRLDAPAGYAVNVENVSGRSVVQEP
jgi:alpha-L-rhamnosidase